MNTNKNRLYNIYIQDESTANKILNYLTSCKEIGSVAEIPFFPSPSNNPFLSRNGRISFSKDVVQKLADRAILTSEEYEKLIREQLVLLRKPIYKEGYDERQNGIKKETNQILNLLIKTLFEHVDDKRLISESLEEDIRSAVFKNLQIKIEEYDNEIRHQIRCEEYDDSKHIDEYDREMIEIFAIAKGGNKLLEYYKEKEDYIVKIAEQIRVFAAKNMLMHVSVSDKNKKCKEIEDALIAFYSKLSKFFNLYGTNDMKLSNLEELVDISTFESIVGITPKQFKFLRDGGYTRTKSGGLAYYEGEIFNEDAFNRFIGKCISKRDVVRVSKTDKSPTIQYSNTCEYDDILKYLDDNNVLYVDNRCRGGSLWLIGGCALQEVVDNCKAFNVNFVYKANGSRATKGKKGWYSV